MPLRRLVILLLIVQLAGCQLWSARKAESEPEPAESAVPVAETVEPADQPPRLDQAIEYLQDGDSARAEAILEAYLLERPGHGLAGMLLEQVRRPPAELLGDDLVEVVVQPGDSLSALARRHAGNSLLFFALARLNDIERPRLLQPGSVVLVPASDPPYESETVDHAEQAAAALLARDEADQALALLTSAARAGGLSEGGAERLVEAGVTIAHQRLEAGQVADAAAVLDEVGELVGDSGDHPGMQAVRQRVEARQALAQAREAAERGEHAVHREQLQRALALDPGLAEAERELADSGHDLVAHYHDLALRAWRDQDVQLAVDYWERVLEIDDEFRPAAIYLERAREALRRLEALR